MQQRHAASHFYNAWGGKERERREQRRETHWLREMSYVLEISTSEFDFPLKKTHQIKNALFFEGLCSSSNKQQVYKRCELFSVKNMDVGYFFFRLGRGTSLCGTEVNPNLSTAIAMSISKWNWNVSPHPGHWAIPAIISARATSEAS